MFPEYMSGGEDHSDDDVDSDEQCLIKDSKLS
jgi:hypothetical protein